MYLLMTFDMLLSKSSLNSANNVTKAVLAKQLTDDAKASFNDKRAKVVRSCTTAYIHLNAVFIGSHNRDLCDPETASGRSHKTKSNRW